METTKIRVSKIKTLPIFALLIISYGVLIWKCFFSDEFTSNGIKIMWGISLLPLTYLLYWFARNTFNSRPFLVLHKSGIDIRRKAGIESCLWLQVTNWRFGKDRYGNFLVLETTDGEKTINISRLDKTQAQIEALMQQYKPK